jgi:hypothetical protein
MRGKKTEKATRKSIFAKELRVLIVENRNQCTRIDQYPASRWSSHRFFPKPSKCRRLVLRSFGPWLTQPISPAAFAAS